MTQEKRICSWCKNPMGNSWHKSANGNYIHVKCVSNFKSYFKYKKSYEQYTKCRKCGYQPMSLVDSVRHSIDGCEKELWCINCQKLVARYIGKIDGQTTWFAICSECLYGVKGWTKKDIEDEERKIKSNSKQVKKAHKEFKEAL